MRTISILDFEHYSKSAIEEAAASSEKVARCQLDRSEPNTQLDAATLSPAGASCVQTSGVSHHPVAFPLSVLAPSYEVAFGST